jgi:hypothetical protein
MTKIYVVSFIDLLTDTDDILKAFTSKEEANRYLDLLEDQDEDLLIFYTTEVELYNNIEDIDG